MSEHGLEHCLLIKKRKGKHLFGKTRKRGLHSLRYVDSETVSMLKEEKLKAVPRMCVFIRLVVISTLTHSLPAI